MGARISAPCPRARAKGSIPNIMARVVIKIGRSLVRPAAIRASRRSIPRERRVFVKSTSRMAFFVTKPMSMMSPMRDIMLTVSRVSKSIPAMPTIESGRENMMARGSMKDSNWAARMR